MYEDILLNVRKPAQYIGREFNCIRKDFEKCRIKFAISFPDLYEVGMSNLGLRIIYGLLNNLSDVVCERVFSPQPDLEEILRASSRELLTLESGRRLIEFDFLGFSLGSELDYTNVLNILELGGLPLKAQLRNQSHPLVIGGGPATMNPEPMHEFFDFFVIGEAEELTLEIIDLYRSCKDEYKSAKMSKQDLLLKLSQLEGVYVPSFYKVDYDQTGKVLEFKPKINGISSKVKKRIIPDLNLSYYPLSWLVPYIEIIHDRITLEIMRGCPNKCRFCQARSQYFPFRQRNRENILNLAQELYNCTGYDELSLAGLSVSDHAQLEEISVDLMKLFDTKGVGLSLPSIKAKALVGEVSSIIAKFKKTSLTFAPEAGTERLRNVLCKDFNSEEFFSSLERSYLSGYQHVKLYFMIGLPGEREEDLDAIVDFSIRVSELRRKAGLPAAGVNISINALIPKPHTPFQWFPMQDLEAIKIKQEYISKKTKKNRRIKLSFHNSTMSFIEGIFSRGDRRLSKVVLNAFKKGARLDAWSDYFNFDIWISAFREEGIDPDFYLAAKDKFELLPWDFIDTRIDKEALILEFNKSVAIQ
ncbi:MAG: TIGR03960 family B12-binding radical SAM protein [Candidatus Omnitrophica bacterium]|nr:TIGR03960 family B12-binding radical SAM protein [Candidatus Omnitrophota bacterium]